MLPQLNFFVSVAFGFIVWGIVAKQYVWPQLRGRQRAEARRCYGTQSSGHGTFERAAPSGTRRGIGGVLADSDSFARLGCHRESTN